MNRRRLLATIIAAVAMIPLAATQSGPATGAALPRTAATTGLASSAELSSAWPDRGIGGGLRLTREN